MAAESLAHPEVVRYLAELDGRLAVLPDDYRAEVLEGIREHLAAALPAETTGSAPPAAVLAALGSPAEIAAEAVSGYSGDLRSTPAAADAGTSGGQSASGAQGTGGAPGGAGGLGSVWIAVPALLLLAVGNFLVPVAGWLAGILLLCLSTRWTPLQKLIGSLTAPLLAAGYAVVAYLLSAAGRIEGWAPLEGLRPALLAQLVVVAWLAVRMRRDAGGGRN